MARCVICGHEDDFIDAEWYSLELRRWDNNPRWETIKTVKPYVENALHIRQSLQSAKDDALNGDT